MMENFSKDFYGDEFRWFLGIVEDIMDPLEMGRVRVRVFGMHSPYYKDIAVEDLPWAQVMVPAMREGFRVQAALQMELCKAHGSLECF